MMMSKSLVAVFVLLASMTLCAAHTGHRYGDCKFVAMVSNENLKLVSEYRKGQGLGGLTKCNNALRRAKKHTKKMCRKGKLYHSAPSVFLNYENVAYTYGTKETAAQMMFDGWKNSPGHNTNMLRGDAECAGIALVRAEQISGDLYYWYGTQIIWRGSTCSTYGC